ncbi:DinB family protein [Planctomycetota bacterium]|nr:DinB family protein [Planctomycetota bacterium]
MSKMTSVQLLANGFESAWKDEYESLASVLSDLSEIEAGWQPTSYQSVEHDAGVGVPGTILWHLNHLELCHRAYLQYLQQRPVESSPDISKPGEMKLQEILPALEVATADLLAAYRGLGEDDLCDVLNPRRNVANFISMTTRHMAWHAAQIAQTRRIFTNRR